MSNRLKRILGGSISVEPDNRTFEELTPEEQELRKATQDFYEGKGFPLSLYKKHFQGSLTYTPTNEDLRRAMLVG